MIKMDFYQSFFLSVQTPEITDEGFMSLIPKEHLQI